MYIQLFESGSDFHRILKPSSFLLWRKCKTLLGGWLCTDCQHQLFD